MPTTAPATTNWILMATAAAPALRAALALRLFRSTASGELLMQQAPVPGGGTAAPLSRGPVVTVITAMVTMMARLHGRRHRALRSARPCAAMTCWALGAPCLYRR